MSNHGTPVSRLEQLPNELIQQIFFHCFEVNLPRASLKLAEALSTESTYTALILFAYFDDDGQHPVDKQQFLPAVYEYLTIEDRMRLQRKILSCRWCTLERIKSCLPALSRLQMVQAWHKERDEESILVHDSALGTTTELVVSDSDIEGLASLPPFEDHEAIARHFFANDDYGSPVPDTRQASSVVVTVGPHNPRIVTWRSILGSESTVEITKIYKTTDNRATTLAARVLPEWLLRGDPWTQGKVELLQLLRQGFRFITRDFVIDVSAAALFDGMSSAIRETNVTALLTLLELHNDVFEIQSPVDDEPRLTSPTYHPLPTQLFHAATRAGAKSSELMWYLARGGGDAIPRDDGILTAWALRGKAAGDQVASWLLEYMCGTRDYQLGRRGYFFVKGSLTWRVSADDLPPASRRFAEELGYLEHGKTFWPTSLDGGLCG